MSADPRTVQTNVPAPQREERKPTPNAIIHAEIENIRRIVNGANKRLERLCEQVAKK